MHRFLFAFGVVVSAFPLASLPGQQTTWTSVRQAADDPSVATLAGGTMLSIPGVFTDFVLAGGGQFVQLPNGEARLTCRVFSENSIYSAFLVDITFANRLTVGAPGYPPAGAPDIQLLTSAYTPVGPVDPNVFDYYQTATGTLTGVRNLDGAVLSLTATTFTQVGDGANNRNAHAGMQATFAVTVLQHPPLQVLTPTGTATLTIDFRAPTAEDTTHPQPDPPTSPSSPMATPNWRAHSPGSASSTTAGRSSSISRAA
jgi:hypothetical protein